MRIATAGGQTERKRQAVCARRGQCAPPPPRPRRAGWRACGLPDLVFASVWPAHTAAPASNRSGRRSHSLALSLELRHAAADALLSRHSGGDDGHAPAGGRPAAGPSPGGRVLQLHRSFRRPRGGSIGLQRRVRRCADKTPVSALPRPRIRPGFNAVSPAADGSLLPPERLGRGPPRARSFRSSHRQKVRRPRLLFTEPDSRAPGPAGRRTERSPAAAPRSHRPLERCFRPDGPQVRPQ